MYQRTWLFVPTLLLFSLLFAACTSSPTQPDISDMPDKHPPTPSPVATAMLQEQPLDLLPDTLERHKTVIFETDGGAVHNPSMCNPLLNETRLNNGMHQAMIEPLFVLNYESGAIEPWLGLEMVPNATQDVWTLNLRDGVEWSDGVAFDAEDVIYTLHLILSLDSNKLNPYTATLQEWVDDVEKVDTLSVRFHLKKPNPRFQIDHFAVKIWSSVPIIPKHIWEHQDPLTFANCDLDNGGPVFTGPYTLEHASTNLFIYARHDAWWGAKASFRPLPQPEKLIWVAPESEQARRALVEAGMLDSLMDTELDTFLAFQKHNPNMVSWFDDLPYAWLDPCTRLLSLNHSVEPWNDKDMRWAINYAIDREEMVDKAYHGTTVASQHFFPAYPMLNRYVELLEDEGLYEIYPLMLHDPERARAIIESKGWTKAADGFYQKQDQPLKLDIMFHDAFIEKQRIAEVLVEQLHAVGIQAAIQPVREEDWWYNKDYGLYESAVDWDACDSVNEPWASLNRYHMRWIKPVGEPVVARNNHIRWRNYAYSDIVDRMGVLPLHDPQVDVLFVEAMDIWFDELPFVPLTQARKLILFDTTYWEGWPTANNNYIHPPTWWQSAHMIIHHLEPTGNVSHIQKERKDSYE